MEQKIELELDDCYRVVGCLFGVFFQEIRIMFPVLNTLSGFICQFTCVDYTPETLLVWHYFEFSDFRIFLTSRQVSENLNKIA